MKKSESKKFWYFTFGSGQAHDGCYIKFFGTRNGTRDQMFNSFGDKWSMQYSEKQWKNPSEDSKKHRGFKPTDKVTAAEVWGWKQLN